MASRDDKMTCYTLLAESMHRIWCRDGCEACAYCNGRTPFFCPITGAPTAAYDRCVPEGFEKEV